LEMNRSELIDKFKKIASENQPPPDDIARWPEETEQAGEPLPPYLPYVGKKYGEIPKKILFLAESQNLAGNTVMTMFKKLKKHQQPVTEEVLMMDRLQILGEKEESEKVWVGPFDDGHGIVLCALALDMMGSDDLNPPREVVSVTNFVKYSYFKGRRNLTPPDGAYEHSSPLVKAEIKALEPNLIIAMGAKTAYWTKILVKENIKKDIPIVSVRHCSKLSLYGSTRYVDNRLPKQNDFLLSKETRQFKKDVVCQLEEIVRKRLELNGEVPEPESSRYSTYGKLIERDWLYFLICLEEIQRTLKESL